MSRAYFIAATGTDIGKTFVTSAITHALRAQGIKAQALKPIISGWAEGDVPDSQQLLDAMGDGQRAEDISPWRFAAPISPHRAAALEQRVIDPSALVEWTRTEMQKHPFTLIEGVGGVMVPLTDTYTTLDWMAAVGLPVILVTGSYLGTISHTLTALAALRARGLEVAALVLSESACSLVSLAEAQAGLLPFIQDIPLRIVQPRVSSWREAEAIRAEVGALL